MFWLETTMVNNVSHHCRPAMFTSGELNQHTIADRLKVVGHIYVVADQSADEDDESDQLTDEEDWGQIGAVDLRKQCQERSIDPTLLEPDSTTNNVRGLNVDDSKDEVVIEPLSTAPYPMLKISKELTLKPKMPKQPPGSTKKQQDANRYAWNKKHRTPDEAAALSKKRSKAWRELSDERKEAKYFQNLELRLRESDEIREYNKQYNRDN
ncbi:hypothetical protein BKA64DRAFT_717152 [Cadophora sp. MPI-SDFR-AT-0126]|nr:hypothetical protein BKA64DRAFT_717152 [Leotiomycetes sp. MPI-SDFR-AT-0126]